MKNILKIGFIVISLLVPSITIASDCKSVICKIVVLDAPYRETVYDIDNYLQHRTNANAVKDILLSGKLVDINVATRTTGSDWLNNYNRCDEVINIEPDLIILHTSSFFTPRGVEETRKNLYRSLKYLSINTNSKFLIYGSYFRHFGGVSNYKRYLLKIIPELESRLTIILIQNRSFHGSRVSRQIVGTVKAILGL